MKKLFEIGIGFYISLGLMIGLTVFAIAYENLSFKNEGKDNFSIPEDYTINDDPRLYTNWNQSENIKLVLVDKTDYNLQLLEWIDEDDEKIKLDTFFKDLGYKSANNLNNTVRENSSIEIIRSSLNESINSYKVRLDNKTPLWENQNVLNLYKFPDDPLMIRTKLSLDYLGRIDNITSFRTWFADVKLAYENGISEEDYGLYIIRENGDELYLNTRQLDPYASFYKVDNFNFTDMDRSIILSDDKKYDKDEFEEYLEIKGNDDHQSLINFIEAFEKKGDDFFDTYVEEENFLTWMAINLLFDNYSNTNKGYFIFSPIYSEKMFFVPYEFEKSWGSEKTRGQWQSGIHMLWDNELCKEYLSDRDNIYKLIGKLDELKITINAENTLELLNEYYKVIEPRMTSYPDAKNLQTTFKEYKRQWDQLPEFTGEQYDFIIKSLNIPTTFNLKNVEENDGIYTFSWEESIDLELEDDISYQLIIYGDVEKQDIIYTSNFIYDLEVEYSKKLPDKFYWTIISRNERGGKQVPMDLLIDRFGEKNFGIKEYIGF